MLKAVRGATTVEANTEAAIREAVAEMLRAVIDKNLLTPQTAVTTFFTVTPDITVISPGKVLRTELKAWDQVPIFCSQEPFIEDLPALCVRVLIQFDDERPRDSVVHVYQRGARILRPDWLPTEN